MEKRIQVTDREVEDESTVDDVQEGLRKPPILGCMRRSMVFTVLRK